MSISEVGKKIYRFSTCPQIQLGSISGSGRLPEPSGYRVGHRRLRVVIEESIDGRWELTG